MQMNRTIRHYKGIIHDFDGNLVDTVELSAKAWAETFSKRGTIAPVGRIIPLIGTSSHRIITDCFDPQASPDTVKALINEKWEIYGPMVREKGRALLFDGVEQTLITLNEKGIKQSIGTAGTKEMITELAEATGLSKLISALVSSDDVRGKGKPDPAIFLEASRQMDIHPSKIIIVGDVDSDMEAGRNGNFGLTVQHISKGSHSSISGNADLVIHGYPELLRLLRL